MAKNSRISHSKPLFFVYMRKTNTYILASCVNPITGATTTNWVRFNWLSDEKDQWGTFAAQAAAFETQWANKADRTETLRIQIDKLISDVHTYDHDNHLLDRIAAQSPKLAFITDYTNFNIQHNLPDPAHSGLPTARQTVTEKVVYFSVTNGSAGHIIAHCKPTEAGKRSHLLKGYHVEIFYEILAQNAPAPSVNQLTEHEVFTKSHFIIDLTGHSGQKLFIAMRWRHKTNPALSGSLDAIQSITIS